MKYNWFTLAISLFLSFTFFAQKTILFNTIQESKLVPSCIISSNSGIYVFNSWDDLNRCPKDKTKDSSSFDFNKFTLIVFNDGYGSSSCHSEITKLQEHNGVLTINIKKPDFTKPCTEDMALNIQVIKIPKMIGQNYKSNLGSPVYFKEDFRCCYQEPEQAAQAPKPISNEQRILFNDLGVQKTQPDSYHIFIINNKEHLNKPLQKRLLDIDSNYFKKFTLITFYDRLGSSDCYSYIEYVTKETGKIKLHIKDLRTDRDCDNDAVFHSHCISIPKTTSHNFITNIPELSIYYDD